MIEIAHVMLQAYTVAKETINIMDQKCSKLLFRVFINDKILIMVSATNITI